MFARHSLITRILLTSLLSLAAVACADDDVPVGETGDALRRNSAASEEELVGDYQASAGDSGDFGRLTLQRSATGAMTFRGSLLAPLAGRRVLCVRAPCRVPVTGTWETSATGKGLYLEVAGVDAVIKYAIKLDGNTLTLKRGSKTQELAREPSAECGGRCGEDALCDEETSRCVVPEEDESQPTECEGVTCRRGTSCRVMYTSPGNPYAACMPRP